MMFSNTRDIAMLPDRAHLTIAIDAEEDFDWSNPVQGSGYSTECMQSLGTLQSIVASYGITPTYLLTYPILESDAAIRQVRHYVARGDCLVGIQLHAWVTPPFADGTDRSHSFLGNIESALEEKKLLSLHGRFETRFAARPQYFRAGRYGLSPATGRLIEELGISIDTSLAPRTDFSAEGGPDYSQYDCTPFWFGGKRAILELPLCRSIVGWGARQAPMLYRALSGPALRSMRPHSILTRSRLAERITLSPEGNDFAAMKRLVRHLHRRGERLFVLSFHSSSLAVGRNPYVQTRHQLHEFYDTLSLTLGWMIDEYGMQPSSLDRMRSALESPQ